MEFLMINKWLILAFLLSGGYLLLSVLRKGSGNPLTPAEAVSKINREKAIVVDIRNPETFEVGHLVGSRNLPLSKLKTDGVSGLPKNKSLPLILVCATGATAKGAAAYFKKEGYENVFVLAGGIGAWIKEEFPIEKKLTPEEKKAASKGKKKTTGKENKSVSEESKPVIEENQASSEEKQAAIEDSQVTPEESVATPEEKKEDAP